MSGGSTCIGKGGINMSGGRGDQHAWEVYMLWGGGLHAWQRGAATCYMLGRGGRLHATCLAEGGGYMLDRGGDYMLGRGGGYTLGKGRGDYFSSTM